MLVVPNELTELLCQGVRVGVFGAVSEEIAQMTLRERRAEAYVELRERFTVAVELLDQIGWGGRGGPAKIEIDVDRYGALVLEGLQIVRGDEQAGGSGGTRLHSRPVAVVPMRVLDEFLALIKQKMGGC